MRYAFKVQYIGKNYAGSQIQFRNGEQIEIPTIQGELEKALSTLITGKRCDNSPSLQKQDGQNTMLENRCCNSKENERSNAVYTSGNNIEGDCKSGNNQIIRPVKTVFSGRTDRGVNSLGQVVHFDTDKTIVASEFMYHLNEKRVYVSIEEHIVIAEYLLSGEIENAAASMRSHLQSARDFAMKKYV